MRLMRQVLHFMKIRNPAGGSIITMCSKATTSGAVIGVYGHVIENAVRLYKDEGIRRNAICPRRMDTKAVLANGLLGWEKVQTLL
ncbi:hypothetical protein WG66_003869 [Moniliophthora roreri]|nr:hypothetical protein WG66_003869 [Moniliophthora roreri]